MAEEVIALPKIGVRDLIGNQLLHSSPQVRVFLQIAVDVGCLLVNIESLGPFLKFSPRGILGEVLGRSVYHM
jgi:hypothetical protein